jgi:hypothetical protein
MKLADRPPLRLLAFVVSLLTVVLGLGMAQPVSASSASSAAEPTAVLAGSYSLTFNNTTYWVGSDGSFENLKETTAGKITGTEVVNPPLYGGGSLKGEIKGSSITFTVTSPQPNPCDCTVADYTGTVSANGDLSGDYTAYNDGGAQSGTWTASTSKCTKPYSQQASWDTERVASDVPGIADYTEPINVIISACSTVLLSDIQAALGNWDTISPTWDDVDGLHFKCISPEKADVAGHGYVTENVAWRLDGCAWGNALSLVGTENHVRIWNQPAEDSSVGAWFVTASYETACLAVNLKLFTLKSEEKHVKSSMKFWHCVDGGPGSFGSDGYGRGAKDFANAVVGAARRQGWNVSEKTITRPITGGQDVGEDGVKFNGTVYVLTVTK